MENNRKVLVLGDSYTRDVEKYTQRKLLRNMGLHVEVRFMYISSISDSNTVDAIMNIFKPSLLIVQIGGDGGNYLDDISANKKFVPQRMATFLQHISNLMNAYKIKRCYVCQQLARQETKTLSVDEYNYLVWYANESVMHEANDYPNIRYWRHKGMMNPIRSIFTSRVKLNQFGIYKLYRSIRGCILRDLKRR